MAVGPPLRSARGRRSWACSSRTRSRSILYHAFTRWDGIDAAAVGRPAQLPVALARPDLPARPEEQRDLRAVGPDPGRPAAARRLRDPPSRAGLEALPRHRLPARRVRDGRDRHPQRRPCSSSTARSTRRSARSACDGLEREWLGGASTSIPLILLVVVWTNFGYNVLLYLAGMSAIDPSLEEAARIDGAGWLRILFSVIVPEPAARARDRARREHDHRVRVHVHVHLHDHERRARHRHLRVRVLHLPAGVHEPEHGLRGRDRRHARPDRPRRSACSRSAC